MALGWTLTAQASTKPLVKKHLTSKNTASKSTPKLSAHHVSSRRRHSHGTPFRYRLAHLQMNSDRIEEIQAAMAKDGYYQGVPTGKWDEQSKAAMRQCQAANGFEQTGLPDAKSLMKLGLGPHPLPLELDPKAESRMNVEAAPKSLPSAGATSPENNHQPNNPNNQR